MAQLNFYKYPPTQPNDLLRVSNGTITFSPFNLADSISLSIVNLYISRSSASMTHTLSLGLYSLTGATLSIANSLSLTFSGSNNQRAYISLTDISAASNLTPGTWYWGFLFSTGGNSAFDINAVTTIVNPINAFPTGFVGGRMTDSTNALPGSYATSDLDITGTDAMNSMYILLST